MGAGSLLRASVKFIVKIFCGSALRRIRLYAVLVD